MFRMMQKYGYPNSRFLSVEGLQIHYLDEDDTSVSLISKKSPPPSNKPVLVLVHGTFASLHTWDGWVQCLHSKFRIIRIDLPGFGFSGPIPNHDYSPENFAHILYKFLVAMPNSPLVSGSGICLAGNSLGGLVCWKFAFNFPKFVKALILIASMGPLFIPPPIFLLSVVPGFSSCLRWAIPQSWITHYIRQVYGDGARVDPFVLQRYDDINRCGCTILHLCVTVYFVFQSIILLLLLLLLLLLFFFFNSRH
jgi:pimeloyl-ACP methyl ester carboxylesterase